MLQIRFLLKRRLTEQKEKFLLPPIRLKVEMKSISVLLLTKLMKSIQERISTQRVNIFSDSKCHQVRQKRSAWQF
jgi:hypothetical protein